MKLAIRALIPASVLLYFPLFPEEFETPKAYALVTFGCFAFFFVKWKHLRTDIVAKCLLLFTLSAAVSTVFSIEKHMSIFGNPKCPTGLAMIVSFLVLYVALQDQLRRKREADKTVAAILWCSFIVASYAVLQVMGYDFKNWVGTLKTDGYIRPMSFLGHPNFMANYLAMTLPFALWKLDTSKNEKQIPYAAVAALSCLAIFLSQSRGMLFAAFAGVATYCLVTKAHTKKILTLFGVSVAIVLTSMAASKSLRITALNRAESIVSPGPARLEYWKGALRIWARYPILGVGTDAYEIGFQHQRTPFYWQVESAGSPHKAHNDFLNILATQGLFGAFAAALLSLAVFFRIRNSYSKFKAPAAASIAAFYVAGLSSFSVVGVIILALISLSLLKGHRQ